MAAKVYCLDSDVLIWHLRNAKKSASVTAHLKTLSQTGALACSVLSIAEVEQGVRPGEEDKTRLFLHSLDCYPVERAIAERAGELVRGLRKQGRTLGLADALIASTCLEHDLVLVSLNVDDFKIVEGLALETVPEETSSPVG